MPSDLCDIVDISRLGHDNERSKTIGVTDYLKGEIFLLISGKARIDSGIDGDKEVNIATVITVDQAKKLIDSLEKWCRITSEENL